MNFKRFVTTLVVITICGGLIWWGEQHNQVDMDHRHEPTPPREVQLEVQQDKRTQEDKDEPLFYISTPFVSVGIL